MDKMKLTLGWGTIRKFGLDYCDLPTILWNVTSMLRWVALDIDPRNEPVRLIFYIIMIVLGGSYVYVYLVSMAWFVFWRCRERGDVLIGIIVFSLGITSQISMSKYLCLFAQRKRLRNLTSAYLASDAQVVPNTRFAANLTKTLRTVQKRALIVMSVIFWNCVLYIIMPLFKPGRQFMEEGFEFFGFKDMDNMKLSPNYEIAFTVNILAILFAGFPMASMTAYFIVIVGYIEAQILALSIELRNVWADAKKDCYNNVDFISHIKDSTADLSNIRKAYGDLSREIANNGNRALSDVLKASNKITKTNTAFNRIRKFKNQYNNNNSFNAEKKISIYYSEKPNNKNEKETLNQFITKHLEDIIKSHTININLLKNTEDIFKIVIALEFTLLMMGLISQLLGGLENTYIQMPFTFMPIIIDCLAGQHLKDASIMFQEALYDSKWEKFDIRNRKMILLMLINSRKALKLSAGGIVPLSLECFMFVLNKTYSAYTTLRSIMK